jgi:hypothetical protein
MGTTFLGMVCDEHGTGDNDAHLGRINVFLPRGIWRQVRAPRGVLGPRARRDRPCNPKSPLSELFSPDNLVNYARGQNWAKDDTKKVENQFL